MPPSRTPIRAVSNNYACLNCCNDVPTEAEVTPESSEGVVGGAQNFVATQRLRDCYGYVSSPTEVYHAQWTSSDDSVASVSVGQVTGQAPGTVTITAEWTAQTNTYQYETWDFDHWAGLGGTGSCQPDTTTLSATATYTVKPGVGRIQHQSDGSFTDISGILFVLKGTAVTFKAIPDPESATWPANSPTWSGTSGATGAGETVSVTFNTVSANTSDVKTVIASAGGSSKTVNVLIYELTTTTTPRDNFMGRSATDYGLKEVVDLDFTTSPTGITATQAGGLNWSKKTGAGTVTATSGDVGTGTYDAGTSAGAVTLSLKVVAGPSKGQERTLDRTVVAPSDAVMSQTAGTGIQHVQHYIHVGFKGTIRLRPTNVSFANIHFQEGNGTATASGCWAFENGKVHSATGAAVSIGGCNSATGCVVNGTDTVESAGIGPYPAPPPTPAYCTGDFVWPIAWQYSTNSGTSWTTFTTATHHHWADGGANLGRANIEKKGAGPFSKHATDPTSTY